MRQTRGDSDNGRKRFVSLFDGTGNAQSLFMSGKIKMKGNMGLMKLQQLTKLQRAAFGKGPFLLCR